jgi:CubicO group peptidase (beta-lactamase class C family)
LGFASPASQGFDPKQLERVDELAQTAIDSMMTPGMRILVARKNKIIYDKNFGYHTYKKTQAVGSNAIYDLASLTKILGTLPLVMQAVAEGELTFETTVEELVPEWSDSNKAKLRLKEMLSHQAYLFPGFLFTKRHLTLKVFQKKRCIKPKLLKSLHFQ